MALNRRPYVGVLVTLSSAGVVYNLKALVDTVIAAESQNTSGATAESPGAVKELYLQSPLSNAGNIFLGDANLAAGGTGRASGYLTKAGETRHYGTGDTKSVDYAQLYVTPDTDGDALYVELLVG